ncbi:MAG: septum formation inhibitor Maf [Acidobacteria bacterium]|nr:septum formation inhibitor Maf [Acidobacteriota bacterium]
MLILASASPRRAELLKAAGIDFTVKVSDVDESLRDGESPRDYVLRLSLEKALAVAGKGDLVLGADTTVVIDSGHGGEIAGKPVDAQDARRMLKLLSGRRHEVLTGVSLVLDDRIISEVEVTQVEFAIMTDDEIDWYVSTGEPMDKAGAYGIQGYASRFIERIEGNYSNVVGLPVQLVYAMLKKMKNGEWRMENAE